MTYNVHETITRDGRLDPEAIADTVRRLRPDVLVVQEAGRGWPLSAGLDLAEWVKRRLGMPYVWARPPTTSSATSCSAGFRWSAKSSGCRMPTARCGGARSWRGSVPSEEPTVTVIGTHLQNGEARDRARGADRTRCGQSSGRPAPVAGR